MSGNCRNQLDLQATNRCSINRIAIFGTGEGAKCAIQLFKGKSILVAFADNNRAKQGQYLNDVRIISAEELVILDVDRIVIASMYGTQIRAQLLELGIPKKKIFSMSAIDLGQWKQDQLISKRKLRRRILLSLLVAVLLWWVAQSQYAL